MKFLTDNQILWTTVERNWLKYVWRVTIMRSGPRKLHEKKIFRACVIALYWKEIFLDFLTVDSFPKTKQFYL